MPAKYLLSPIITEKSLQLAQAGQFCFSVAPQATKTKLKKAIEDIFKVNVLKIRVLKVSGKTRRSGKKRLTTKTADKKKAIITLQAGQTIEYFQLPEEKSKKKTKTKKTQLSKPKTSPKAEKPKKGGLFSRFSKDTRVSGDR